MIFFFSKKIFKKVSVICISFVFLISALSLTGCTASNGGFQCPDKGGVMCKRLDQVNSMVDKGEISETSSDEAQGNCITLKDNCNTESCGLLGNFNNYSKPFATTLTPGEPLRYGETVMRVWIAPYVDKDGDYHHQSYVDVVVKPGHWIGNPISTKKFFN